MQSSKKQKKRSCTGRHTDRASEACALFLPHTGQLHGPCKRENSQHGSSTRDVSVRHATFIFHTWGSNTNRVRWLASHGSPARGVFARRAELTFRTRGVLSNTDRVHILACTGLRGFARGAFLGSARGVQIGTGHTGSARVKLGFARVVQFSLL